MSHRQEDNYGFVATQTIRTGMVVAFNPGDAIPESTVKEQGYEESGQAVKRSEWENRPADEPERAMVRGEMPPHLRDKTASDAKSADTKSTGKADAKTEPDTGDESATAKSVKAGGSSRRTPPTPTNKGSDT